MAAILTIVTALEVGVTVESAHYIRLTPIIVPLLLVMSVAKFALVVLFFMHLRYDRRVLTRVRGPHPHRRARGGPDDPDRRLPGLRA